MPESNKKKTKTRSKKRDEQPVSIASDLVFGEKEAEPVEKTVPKQPVPAPPPPSAPRISFERWFRSKGFKDHWKPGMQAFTNTSGRRSKEEWDQLFEKY